MSVEDETWDKPIRKKIVKNPNPISAEHKQIYKQMYEDTIKESLMKKVIKKPKSYIVDNYFNVNKSTQHYLIDKLGIVDKKIVKSFGKNQFVALYEEYHDDTDDEFSHLNSVPFYYLQKCGIDVARVILLPADYKKAKILIDEIQSSIYFIGWILDDEDKIKQKSKKEEEEEEDED